MFTKDRFSTRLMIFLALVALLALSAFTTAGCPEENSALVNLQFGEATIRQLLLELVSADGSLRIDSINHVESPQPAEKEGWLPLVDESYGYAVRCPAGWTVMGPKVSEGHTPEEYPQMRRLYFQLTPDTEIPPFSLEVVVWPKGDLSELYSLSEKIAETTVNGYPAQVW